MSSVTWSGALDVQAGTRASARQCLRIGVVAALAALALLGCVDPTDGVYGFDILNDTPQAVLVRYCDNQSCSRVDYEAKVASGDIYPANTAGEEFDEWYQFADADSGIVFGCKTLNFRGRKHNVIVRVSTATPCST